MLRGSPEPSKAHFPGCLGKIFLFLFLEVPRWYFVIKRNIYTERLKTARGFLDFLLWSNFFELKLSGDNSFMTFINGVLKFLLIYNNNFCCLKYCQTFFDHYLHKKLRTTKDTFLSFFECSMFYFKQIIFIGFPAVCIT